jgi:hypothetical protein
MAPSSSPTSPTGTSFARAAALGGSGEIENVFVTGSADRDYATVAYSAAGAPLWTNRFPPRVPNGINIAEAIAVDETRGSVYVTGRSDGSGTGPDYATIAYSEGGTPLWTNFYNGPANSSDEPPAIAVDTRSGTIYVAGGSIGLSNTADCATVAYSCNGTPLWTNRFGPGTGLAIAVNSAGDAIIAGKLVTPWDIGTIAYSQPGVALWTNRFDGSAHGSDYPAGAASLAVGADGSVFIAGTSQTVHGATTNYDFVLIKYVLPPDILFTATDHLPNGSIRLTISAPTNTAFSLQASANLSTWQTLTNFPPLPVSPVQYTDTLAPAFPARYYRTVWSP